MFLQAWHLPDSIWEVGNTAEMTLGQTLSLKANNFYLNYQHEKKNQTKFEIPF